MSNSVRPHRQQTHQAPPSLGFSRQEHWTTPVVHSSCHYLLQCMKVKSESEVAQSCPTLSDPMDHSLPGSSVHGIFQARVLEWGAFACSEPWVYIYIYIYIYICVCVCLLLFILYRIDTKQHMLFEKLHLSLKIYHDQFFLC